MHDSGTSVDPAWNRPCGHHVVAATVAGLVSLAIHFTLLHQIPPLGIGRPASVDAQQRIPSVQMDQVHRDLKHMVERPEIFRPENPHESLDLSVPVQDWGEALTEVFPEPLAIREEAFQVEEVPLVEPEPELVRTDWDSRQEIMAIEEKIFGEDISALPRFSIPDIKRVSQAPDIALPFDPGHLTASTKPPVPAGGQGEVSGMAGGDKTLQLASRSSAGQRWRRKAQVRSMPDEPSRLLDESITEVTSLKPVEKFLKLDVRSTVPLVSDGYRYFQVQILPVTLEALDVLPRDIMFIQDSSKSMTQTKLNRCKKGLRAWIQTLSPVDRFDIMGFKEEPVRCFDQWRKATPQAIAESNWFIGKMEASGKTDVLKSLQALLKVKESKGRTMFALLVTDGRPTQGIVDTSEIIENFSRWNRGRHSVFTFGGGRRANRYLLDLLSYKNRGDSKLVVHRKEIPPAMTSWALELQRPVLKNLTFRFSGLDENDIYPKTLTHLFLDRPLVLYGRCPLSTRQVAFQILGESGQERHDMVFQINWEKAATGDLLIWNQWGRHKMYYLIGRHIETRDKNDFDRISQFAEQYGLTVPYRVR